MMKLAAIVLSCLAYTCLASDTKVTNIVTMDIMKGEDNIGELVLGLFGETAPKTVENFASLAEHKLGYGFEGSKFHRVINNFMIQGGDFDKQDGTGSKSIYGAYFDDENFTLEHYGGGWLAMANAGPNTNGCQFYITTVETPWLNGKHTVFGAVLKGMDVVHMIENTETDASDKPTQDIAMKNIKVSVPSKEIIVRKAAIEKDHDLD